MLYPTPTLAYARSGSRPPMIAILLGIGASGLSYRRKFPYFLSCIVCACPESPSVHFSDEGQARNYLRLLINCSRSSPIEARVSLGFLLYVRQKTEISFIVWALFCARVFNARARM